MEILRLVDFPQPLQHSLRIHRKVGNTLSTLLTEDLTKYRVKNTSPNMHYHIKLNIIRVE